MINAFDSFIKASLTESPELGKVAMFSTIQMSDKQEVKKEICKVFDFCTNPDDFLNNK